MGDNAILFQALGALLALFFIFLTVMNFKSWRWLHALTTFALDDPIPFLHTHEYGARVLRLPISFMRRMASQ